MVDDDPDTRRLISYILEREGCRVLEAPDAFVALDSCDPMELDLALVDVGLPGMDGLELLNAINDRLQGHFVPIVLVTARAEASDVAAGLRLGASDYLRKPFEPCELVARVDSALKVKRLQDQLQQRNDELARLSSTDAVTGAFNRRHLDHGIVDMCRSALSGDHNVAVLVLDVDHFKAVNDRHGHPSGDRVLRSVAERLQGGLRSADILGRWGGDEFLVLLPATDQVAAVAVAERLRSAVEAEPVALSDGSQVTVTVSIGVASGQSVDPDELVACADRALYAAKAAGRSRVGSGVGEVEEELHRAAIAGRRRATARV